MARTRCIIANVLDRGSDALGELDRGSDALPLGKFDRPGRGSELALGESRGETIRGVADRSLLHLGVLGLEPKHDPEAVPEVARSVGWPLDEPARAATKRLLAAV